MVCQEAVRLRLYLEFLAVVLRIRYLKASIYLYLAYTELARFCAIAHPSLRVWSNNSSPVRFEA